MSYTLIGTEFSYFTAKLRSYLIFKQIPFEEKLSTLSVYKNEIIPNTGVRFIPVLKTPSREYLQDTTAIIDKMEHAFPNKKILI